MLILLTVIPSILILLVIVLNDRFREPTGLVLACFFWGCALCLPAGFLNSLFIWSQENADDLAYLAAITEEPLKFMVIYFFVRGRTAFDEPMDALVYGTAISLGFATLENFEYVFSAASIDQSFEIAVVRAISAVPMHASCGIIMGYYFGRYVFSGDRMMLLKSLAVPILFHGAYNFFCNYSFGLALLLLSGMYLFCDRLHREFRREQELKQKEEDLIEI